MVNYCCVYGCGRNSRINKHLNYYSLPKERHRQVEWLKAAGRDDLLKKEQGKLTVSHRLCSRHFPPSSIKNRHLCADAVPTLYLPGSVSDGDSDEEPQTHTDIVCDNCKELIVGFRYKCVSCNDYDLCQKCEMLEAHAEHYMLRIPKPIGFKVAENLKKKWQRFFGAQHITPSRNDLESDDADLGDSGSSDDEPITKYAKNYDSGIDLSEDVKTKIRNEVTRVLKQVKKPKGKKNERKRQGVKIEQSSKKLKLEENQQVEVVVENAPEVAFADVNEIKECQAEEPKAQFPNSLLPGTVLASHGMPAAVLGQSEQQPVMHVKLSDDLSELMIEVTSNNQKTVYKYT